MKRRLNASLTAPISFSLKFWRLSASVFTPRTSAGSPSSFMYGGTSFLTLTRPPMNANVPIVA